jgi:branched-chain amino acid aminotransferase, group II
MEIRYELLPKDQQKSPMKDETRLGFGQIRTNHMFLADYRGGEWHDPRIVPYGPFSLMPGAMCLHYSQAIFEGAKAFRHPDGEVRLFRYDKNISRFNLSAETLCMPEMPEDLHWEAILRLLDVEREWCPSIPASSLYIRPFMFASQDSLGVKPSAEYLFCIMVSPSGPYYPGGFSQAVSLLVSKKYHRAAPGGTGAAKTGGNYAASLRPCEVAHAAGCAQVLYLDVNNTMIEEAGSMNHFHVLKDGTFIIPEFDDCILTSITSSSVLELAAAGVLKARQEVVPLEGFLEGIRSGEIIECGGFGTAAVISPVGRYVFENGDSIKVGDGTPGKHSTNLYNLYSSFQSGQKEAPMGWMRNVPHF